MDEKKIMTSFLFTYCTIHKRFPKWWIPINGIPSMHFSSTNPFTQADIITLSLAIWSWGWKYYFSWSAFQRFQDILSQENWFSIQTVYVMRGNIHLIQGSKLVEAQRAHAPRIFLGPPRSSNQGAQLATTLSKITVWYLRLNFKTVYQWEWSGWYKKPSGFVLIILSVLH